MKLRLPRRRIWRAAIYLLTLVLVLAAIDLILIELRRTIHPGFDTTRIVAPTLPDGSIDYLQALDDRFGAGVTPDQNAVPLILAALGREALPSDQPIDGITSRLGMAHLPEQGDYFIPYAQFAKERNDPLTDTSPDPLDPAAQLRLPIKAAPLTAAWVRANQRPLETLEDASKRPRFFFPFNGGNRPETLASVLLPYVHLMRESASALLIRAALELDTGENDRCRRDLLTVHRLARLMGQAPTLIERSVAISIEDAACRLERAIANSGKLSAGQSRALASDIVALDGLPDFSDGIDVAERFMVLDFLQSAARAGPARAAVIFRSFAPRSLPPSVVFRWSPVPYEECMRECNHCYDGLLAAIHQPTYRQRHAALELAERDIEKMSGHNSISRLLSADWPMALFMPNLNFFEIRWETSRAQRRLTEVALALAASKIDHGAYPATLTELSPKDLKTVPLDPFSDKPFIYRPNAATYTLYSVGPNMIDDGGNAGGAKAGDDIVANDSP
jgi:hypothetical protein